MTTMVANAVMKFRRVLGQVSCPCCGGLAKSITLDEARRMAVLKETERCRSAAKSEGASREIDVIMELVILVVVLSAPVVVGHITTLFGTPEPAATSTFSEWESPVRRLTEMLPTMVKSLVYTLAPVIAVVRIIALLSLFSMSGRATNKADKSAQAKGNEAEEFPFRNRALLKLYFCAKDDVVFDVVSGKLWSSNGTDLTPAPQVPSSGFTFSRLHRAHGRNWRPAASPQADVLLTGRREGDST